jgi:hypothetical protein
MNKRGISAVVASVLLILLVVGGVAIVWSAVNVLIKDSSSEVEGDCFSVKLKPVSCKIYADVTTAVPPTIGEPPGDYPMDVVVKREAGGGDLTGVKIILDGDVYGSTGSFANSDFNVVAEVEPVDITELGTSNFIFDLLHDSGNNPNYEFTQIPDGGVFAVRKVNVVAVVGDKTCGAVSSPILCRCIGTICNSYGY